MKRLRLAATVACTCMVAVTVPSCSSSGGRSPAALASHRPTSTQPPAQGETRPPASPSLPPGYIRADFQGQPARPCVAARRGQAIAFRIEPATPQPVCWKVTAFDSVRIVNATGDANQRPRVVTGSLLGAGKFRLEPGASSILRLRSGERFATGDHCVYVSLYPGSCLAIWVAPDD